MIPRAWILLPALALTGCETAQYLLERDKPVPIACDSDNCGKPLVDSEMTKAK